MAKNRLIVTSVFGFLLFFATSCKIGLVEQPPPVALVEFAPLSPSPQMAWIGGHYGHRNQQYIWIGGGHVKPHARKVWVPGRDVPVRGKYRYVGNTGNNLC